MTPQERLAQWRATTDAATEGPWVVRKTRSGNTVLEAGENGYDDIIEPEPADCLSYCYGGTSRWTINPADADYMSTSRTAMPALLAFAQAVLALHAPVGVFYVCEHDDRDACDAWETSDGETVCGPALGYVCGECIDESGDHTVAHPCSTARLGDEHLGGGAS